MSFGIKPVFRRVADRARWSEPLDLRPPRDGVAREGGMKVVVDELQTNVQYSIFSSKIFILMSFFYPST